MAIWGRITGGANLILALNNFSKEMEAELTSAVQDTAERVRTGVVRSIQKGPKTGRVYQRGAISHRASAPGQAPATDQGDLASSYHRVDGRLVSAVGSGLDKAPMLEFGTSKMQARPHLFPALEAQRPYYVERLKKATTNAASKVTGKVLK